MAFQRNDAPNLPNRISARGDIETNGGAAISIFGPWAFGWLDPGECLLAVRIRDPWGARWRGAGGLLRDGRKGGENRCVDGWGCFVNARRPRVRMGF